MFDKPSFFPEKVTTSAKSKQIRAISFTLVSEYPDARLFTKMAFSANLQASRTLSRTPLLLLLVGAGSKNPIKRTL